MTALATERCDLRLVPDDKKLLSIAATISGLTMTSFIRNVAIEAAKDVIPKNNVIEFTTKETAELLAAPDKPFKPNPALKKALDLAASIRKNQGNS